MIGERVALQQEVTVAEPFGKGQIVGGDQQGRGLRGEQLGKPAGSATSAAARSRVPAMIRPCGERRRAGPVALPQTETIRAEIIGLVPGGP